MKFKKLDWDMHPCVDVLAKAECLIGTYFIMDDTDDFTGIYCDLVKIGSAKWWGVGSVQSVPVFDRLRYDTHEFEDKVFPLVQSHFEKILATSIIE